MLVDHHVHWYPPAFIETLVGRDRFPRAERAEDGGYIYEFDEEPLGSRWSFARRFFDLDYQLADMDEHGVDVSVLTPTVMGDVTRLELSEARETLDLLNEEYSRAQREHPGRLRALAMLPLQDTSAALETLDHAIADLGLAGVCINTNVAGHSLGSDELLPVYRRIEELGVPIVLHPANRSLVFPTVKNAQAGRVGEIGLGWVFETSLAALSLIYSGTLDECPNLTILHPHTGGVIPFLKGRLEVTSAFHSKELQLARPVGEYLRDQFYADPASGSNPHMIALAIETYGIDHIVWGSDSPFLSRAPIHELLNKLDNTQADQIRSNVLPGLDLATSSQTVP